MEKKKIIYAAVLVVILAAFGLLAYGLIPKAAAIEIPVDSYDFGDVLYGDIASHEFEIKNSGNDELAIQKISTSCGCTTAEISSRQIGPGGSAIVTVNFNPAIHQDDTDLGELTRVVYITSNDPSKPESEITIQANVYKK